MTSYICQQPGRNGQISRNVQPAKTELGKNRQSERQITSSETEFVIKKKKNTASKRKFRMGWLHRGILPNIQRIANTCPSQTILEN